MRQPGDTIGSTRARPSAAPASCRVCVASRRFGDTIRPGRPDRGRIRALRRLQVVMRLWSGTEPGLSAPAARERLLSGWADRRHGIVTVAELRALGFDSSAVRRRVLAGRLHRLYPGVYSYGRRTLTAYGRVLAAVAACGPLAAASHRTAAALWDLRPSERLEVIVPSASGRRHPPGVRRPGAPARRRPGRDPRRGRSAG